MRTRVRTLAGLALLSGLTFSCGEDDPNVSLSCDGSELLLNGKPYEHSACYEAKGCTYHGDVLECPTATDTSSTTRSEDARTACAGCCGGECLDCGCAELELMRAPPLNETPTEACSNYCDVAVGSCAY